jgi:hypothetical protein
MGRIRGYWGTGVRRLVAVLKLISRRGHQSQVRQSQVRQSLARQNQDLQIHLHQNRGLHPEGELQKGWGQGLEQGKEREQEPGRVEER